MPSRRNFHRSNSNNILFTALACFVIAVSGITYLPGLWGPFVFDDATNLLTNDYLKISELDFESLYQAAFSLQAGPLRRPISMASFAVNAYLAGGFNEGFPFKIVNLIIHIVNGLLVFFLLRTLFLRGVHMACASRHRASFPPNLIIIASTVVTVIWMVQPIQITSVLYIVQRMAQLSALFVLLGLLFYVHGRERVIAGRRGGLALMLLGPIGFGALGIFSKETALLLPLFIATIEICLYSSEWPWNQWQHLKRRNKAMVMLLAILAASSLLVFSVLYALPSYSIRNFTMAERILTEARVLFFYLSLILIPQSNRFALHHDDFEISTGLLSPWTTLPALIGIAVFIVLAFKFRRSHPLLTLGILWFFVAHGLESTIFPLELVHEHRNYLASLGIWIVLSQILFSIAPQKVIRTKALLIAGLLIGTFSTVTLLRSHLWSDLETLALFEVTHHPNSADAQNVYGVSLVRQRRYSEAVETFRRAARLNPREPTYMLNLQLVSLETKVELTPTENEETLRRIREHPRSASILHAVANLSTCLLNKCQSAQPMVITWMKNVIDNMPVNFDRTVHLYVLGVALSGQRRYDEAIHYLKLAYNEDRNYLHPLFEITRIEIERSNIDAAEIAFAELRVANQNTSFPRDQEVTLLSKRLENLRHLLGRPG